MKCSDFHTIDDDQDWEFSKGDFIVEWCYKYRCGQCGATKGIIAYKKQNGAIMFLCKNCVS